MCFEPVMNCDHLSMGEKMLLNYIMSLKYSFPNVKVKKDTVMRGTGITRDQFDEAAFGLEKKRLLFRVEGEWLLCPENINCITRENVYDLDAIQLDRYVIKDDEDCVIVEKSTGPKVFHYASGEVKNPYYQEN